MSMKEIQAKDKESSSVEMTTMEKRNSVEVGEVSDISEEDIGEPAWWCQCSTQSSDDISRCRE
jgi:hypothetical protein